jgi:hypothetical protein
MFALDASLDPISGTIVATALRRIERQLFRQDWDDAKAVHGDDTRIEHLARTPAQRRADALVELAERAMAAPTGARMPRPLVTVHVGYETFAGRLCELENGTVIAPGHLLPLLPHADVDHVVEWANGGPTVQENGRLRSPVHNRHGPQAAGRHYL